MKFNKIFALYISFLFLLTACSSTSSESAMTYTGSVEADEIIINSEVSGTIENIIINEGDFVKANTLLLSINHEDLDLELKQLENKKAIASLEMTQLLEGSRNEELARARANLKNISAQLSGAVSAYNYALKVYDDSKSLFESGAITNQTLDLKKTELDQSASRKNSLQKQYDSYNAELSKLLNGARDSDIRKSQLKIDGIDLEIERLELLISKSNLYAPIGGLIQSINFHKGEFILPQKSLISIIDADNLWVKIYISDLNLSNIKIDSTANLYGSDGNLKGTGVVNFISNKAEFTPQNIESKENRAETVFEVNLDIDNSNGDLKPGMLVDVIFQEE
ncbi:MAG: HlyD family efflux transporter periplasmic adaptor subunit [Tissierellales bacterium]|nr:HlyD family efflux transporter periplasmic adaptor subunit [Tissierellales bacterium]